MLRSETDLDPERATSAPDTSLPDVAATNRAPQQEAIRRLDPLLTSGADQTRCRFAFLCPSCPGTEHLSYEHIRPAADSSYGTGHSIETRSTASFRFVKDRHCWCCEDGKLDRPRAVPLPLPVTPSVRGYPRSPFGIPEVHAFDGTDLCRDRYDAKPRTDCVRGWRHQQEVARVQRIPVALSLRSIKS